MNHRAPTSPHPRRRGTTLIDLLMTVAVIGIVVVAIAPTLAPEDPVRLVAAGTLLVSDIEYAQSATLAQPADPTVIRFDDKGAGYWLARASDPDEPILRPGDDEEYRVTFGVGDAETLVGVSIDATQIPDLTITFDAFGRLTTLQNQTLDILNETGTMTITVTATTGSVRLTAAPPAPAK